MKFISLDSSVQVEVFIFSMFPKTFETSDILAKVSGSTCAAHPVTIILVVGFSRWILRISCFDLRTASAVTAQVLTTAIFSILSFLASSRMASVS